MVRAVRADGAQHHFCDATSTVGTDHQQISLISRTHQHASSIALNQLRYDENIARVEPREGSIKTLLGCTAQRLLTRRKEHFELEVIRTLPGMDRRYVTVPSARLAHRPTQCLLARGRAVDTDHDGIVGPLTHHPLLGDPAAGSCGLEVTAPATRTAIISIFDHGVPDARPAAALAFTSQCPPR
jgi:hypothetical protein